MTELIPRDNIIRQPYTVYQRSNEKAEELLEIFQQKIACNDDVKNFLHDLLMEMAIYTNEDYNKDLSAYLKDRFRNQAQAFGFGRIAEEAVKNELNHITLDVLGEKLIKTNLDMMDLFHYMP